MTRWNDVALALTLTGAVLIAGCVSAGSHHGASVPPRLLGWSVELGKGTLSSYAQLQADGTPAAIGVLFSAQALDGLPLGSDGHHCFDRNQDGTIDPATECLHSHEHVLPLPDAVARRADIAFKWALVNWNPRGHIPPGVYDMPHFDIPFKWALVNWNPRGHIPPGVYDVPHFDIHFFMERIERVFALQAGPCGPELMRCDQFAAARKPLPSNYIHPDFKDVEAVVPAMGNHLMDLSGPEFQKQPFTRSWIFGAYDGAITFYEEMVARDFLLRRPDTCFPIKSPEAVARAGFYPTVSCIRHDATTGESTVSLERFVYRKSAPPARP